MEIRNIDPQDQSKITLHAGALGTAKTVHVRQLRHGSLPQQSPAPNPFQPLIDRALNQNAGEVDHRHTSHKLSAGSTASSGPPATSPYFVHKDDSGNEVWWNPRSKSYELKDRAGKAASERKKSVGVTSDSEITLTAPDSHHNAEIVRTDFELAQLSSECQSAPSYPAPNYNHQNADSTGDASQLAISSRKIAVFSRRSAPHPSDGTHGIGLHCSPVGRCLRSISGFLRKLATKVMQKSAYNDPSKLRVNGRWVGREVYEKYR